MKKYILFTFLLLFVCAASMFAERQTIVITESGLPYSSQVSFSGSDIHYIDDQITKYYDEDHYITSVSYTSNNWLVVMSTESGYLSQTMKITSSWPGEWISEQCACYSWGENIMLVKEENGDRYLVNKATGKARQISMPGYVVGFSDDEIDFSTVDKLPHGYKAHSRDMDYTPICWYDRCKNGIIALVWMLYPEGRYFADEEGYGMEDNDEEKIYCILNDNLEVIRPFTVVPNIRALLDQMTQA